MHREREGRIIGGVCAGFAEHTDHEVGRLVTQLEAIGELDNTLFFYIVGDNGSSAEGGPDDRLLVSGVDVVQIGALHLDAFDIDASSADTLQDDFHILTA